jgi:hypothetical protein
VAQAAGGHRAGPGARIGGNAGTVAVEECAGPVSDASADFAAGAGTVGEAPLRKRMPRLAKVPEVEEEQGLVIDAIRRLRGALRWRPGKDRRCRNFSLGPFEV